MPNPIRRAVALAALAVAIVAGAVALDLPSAAAQSDDEQTGRIVAQRLEDGRTEFGWQPAGGERILPRARYFPADAQVDRWLNSSPVEVDGVEIGRINARLRDDGRIEFAFTPTDGERIAPSARYFPVDARVGRWLRSTEIAISAAPVAGFTAVSAGSLHTCAIRESDSAIECWGNNEDGQIDDIPSGRFTAVAAGGRHTCAIRAESGAIECWGSNDDPGYGNNTEQTAAPTGRFTTVSAGVGHTCAIHAGSGAIECWGWNNEGQSDAPAGSFSAVSAGHYYTSAIRTNGEVVRWGESTYGWGYLVYPPTGRFTAVSAGSFETCGLRENGAIECWGDHVRVEQNLPPPGTFTAVSGTCGLRTNGAIVCWGGQTDAPAGSFSAISAGAAHTCGLRTTGEIECWGTNYDGQTDAPDGRFSAVAAGLDHTCAIRAVVAIECWGANDDWRNNYIGQADPPTGSFTAVAAGGGHSCAIRKSDSAIVCWGRNNRWEWNEETEEREEFYVGQADAPAGSFTAVSAGYANSCGLRDTGAIECWGLNREGQATAPTGRFTAVASGYRHTCAIRAGSGEIACWGSNSRPGEAQYNKGTGEWTRPEIYAGQLDAPAGRFTAVAAGSEHTCGLRPTGAIECWGNNEDGQTDTPAGRFTAISDTCAIRSDGAIVCWGVGESILPAD